MTFSPAYKRLFEKLVGRTPTRVDGASPGDLARCEARLKIKLPRAVRESYRVAGACEAICRAHDRIWSPGQLEVDAGYLVFMEENQAVVHGGVPLAQLQKDDPVVWQRVNCEPPEWHSEKLRFSVFMPRRLTWAMGSRC